MRVARGLLFIAGLFISFYTYGQVNPSNLEFTIVQGESISFEVHCDVQDPTLSAAPSHGVVVEENISGNTYKITYTPNSGVVGADQFAVKTLLRGSNPFVPSVESTVVEVNVLASLVEANDDFVRFSENESIVISPLANDSSNTGTHTIKGLSHVMYGEAMLNEDGTVTYIAADAIDMDYIVYTVEDEKGTQDIATIYLQRIGEDINLDDESYAITNQGAQYLFLDDEDFVLESDLEYGELVKVSDFVWEYRPYVGAKGQDLIVMNLYGDKKSIEINIYDLYKDDGTVKDDLVYMPENSETVFNVLENDLDQNLVINESSLSKDLTYLGQGQVSFESNNDFAGIKNYTYEATNGVSTESGKIDIVINNFYPEASSLYTFETAGATPLKLSYVAPIETFSFELSAAPLFGTIELGGELSQCSDQSAYGITYTPYEGFVGYDEFELKYCPGGDNECKFLKTRVHVKDETASNCLNPGDANNDGQVDMLDVLVLGNSFGQQVMEHSDLDNNGYHSVEDLNLLEDYLGNIYTYINRNILSTKDYPFYLRSTSGSVFEAGQKVTFEIVMGNSEYPVSNLNGLAFELNINPAVVDSASMKLTYLNDGFFVNRGPYVDRSIQVSDGNMVTALTRTNGIPSIGFGVVAKLDFIVEEELDGIRPNNRSIQDIVTESIQISDIVVKDVKGHQYSLPSTSASFKVKLTDQVEETSTIVYPNPVKDQLTILPSAGTTEIELIDILGRSIVSQKVTTDKVVLDLRGVDEGMYVLKSYQNNTSDSQIVRVIK